MSVKFFSNLTLLSICLIFLYSLSHTLIKIFLKSHNVIDPKILNLENNLSKSNDLSKEKLLVLVSHYNENLFWLKNIKYPFIISSKIEKNKTLYVSINKGNEAMAYLDYIVKFYDVLPEYTLFLHGHYIDWHQRTPVDKIINNIKLDKPYININDLGVDDRYDNCFNKYYKNLRLVWNELFLDTLGPVQPRYYDKCCAQFSVHRDRIRLRPKKFYQRLINYIINKDNGEMGYILEYIWHNIFGEKPIMEYKNTINLPILKIY